MKILATKYRPAVHNTALLLLRAGASILMMNHGYGKLVKFGEMKSTFMNFMGIGPTASLALTVFAEFFCPILILLGLFTRVAAIPIMVTMIVALFIAHQGQVFEKGEMAGLYLLIYTVILLTGPGKYSVDAMISKN